MISDSPASATEGSLDQPIKGTLDDERGFDYFRFQPVTVTAPEVRVEVVSLEGDPPLVCPVRQRRGSPLGKGQCMLPLF